MESEGFAIYDAMMRMKTEVVFFYLTTSVVQY
jgi:ATP-dependent protease ClpP protease subunit